MGALLGEPLYEMEYTSRLKIMLKHRIGLWDVLHQCERAGALDSDIRRAVHNDFRKVMKIARGLRRVCFNGKTAGRFAPVFASEGYETLILPSSSPAYTLALGVKLNSWRRIMEASAQPLPLIDNPSNAGYACSDRNDGAGGNDGNDGRSVRRRPARDDTPAPAGIRLGAAC